MDLTLKRQILNQRETSKGLFPSITPPYTLGVYNQKNCVLSILKMMLYKLSFVVEFSKEYQNRLRQILLISSRNVASWGES
jgi:hypothetical protein